jgi:protein-tyrosine phosphatase
MAEQNFDLKAHRARALDETMLQQSDLVLCMEPGHVEAIQAEFADHAHKVHLFSQMVGENRVIRDPYGQSMEKYRTMIADLTEIIDSGLDQIIELALKNAEAGDR